MKRSIVCIVLICSLVSILSAQKKSPPISENRPFVVAAKLPQSEPVITRMTVYPAAEPRPAMKYEFLPNLLDRNPGNAATLYLMAMEMVSRKEPLKYYEEIGRWLLMPAKDLPRKKVQEVLGAYRSALHQVELAAGREHCDFEFPMQEGFRMLLPFPNRYRTLAKALALRIRLAVAEGKIDEAMHDLQTGFTMARHVGSSTTLIESLVGMAISSLMCKEVETLQQDPNTPNLYWALAELPRPLIRLRKAMEYEESCLYLTLPKLRNVVSANLSKKEWQRVFRDVVTSINEMGAYSGSKEWRPTVGGVILAVKMYPEAKRKLIARGMSRQKVEAMPVGQVIAIQTLGEYEYWRDEMFKWFALPYWQARPGLERMTRKFNQWSRTEGRGTLPAIMLPALGRAYFMAARSQRQIAILQTIEAVRMYAAANDGTIPATLAELTSSPAPLDPVTGKPFAYTVEGNTFTIDAPAPPGMRRADGQRFVVTVKPKK